MQQISDSLDSLEMREKERGRRRKRKIEREREREREQKERYSETKFLFFLPSASPAGCRRLP